MQSQSTPLPLDRQVKDLAHQIARGRIFYDLWWQLQGEPLENHIDGMNLYPDFFRFTRHAYLYAMIVQTMIPFDQRRDTLSFKTILKQFRKDTNQISIAEKAEQKISGSALLWQKLKIVRDECFAHRSRLISYDAVWDRAAIRPMDIYYAQNTAIEAVNLLERALGIPTTEPHPTPGEEAVALLNFLQKQALA